MDHQSNSDMDLSFGSSGSLKSAGGDKPQNPPIFDLNFPSVQYDFPEHGNLDVTQPEDVVSKPSPQAETTSGPLPVDLVLPEPLLPLRSDEEKELENNSRNFVVNDQLVSADKSKWELPQSVSSASSVLVKPCLSPPHVMLEPLSVELVVERNGEENVVENNSGIVVKDDQLDLAEKSKGKLPQFIVSAPSVVVKPCISLPNNMLEPLLVEFVLPKPLPSLMSGEEKVVEKNSDNAVADDRLVLAEKSKGKMPQFVDSAPSVVVKSSISLPDMLAHLRQLALNPCFVMISKIGDNNCHSMNLALNTRPALYPKVETKISKSLGFPYQVNWNVTYSHVYCNYFR